MGNAESEPAAANPANPGSTMRRFDPLRRSRWRSRSASLGESTKLEASAQAFLHSCRQVSEGKIERAARNQAMLTVQIGSVEVDAERSCNRLRLSSGDFCRACAALQGAPSLAAEITEMRVTFASMLEQAEELRQLLESEPFVLGTETSEDQHGSGDDSYAEQDFSVAYRDL